MCGIVGIFSHHQASVLLYNALMVLQHRGQDAAGMVTCEQQQIHVKKNRGLVSEVFSQEDILRLRGNMGIGHVRYPTAGTSGNADEAQPFYVNSPFGIALGHNGNLINTQELLEALFQQDLRHINTASDSEILLNILAHELQNALQQPVDVHPVKHKRNLQPEHLFAAVRKLHQRCIGAYSAIALITGNGILGFRDPHGIRPLVYGKKHSPQGTEYMIASESVALDTAGFSLVSDLAPGEAIYINTNGEVFRQQCADAGQRTPCMFEYIYLARPDSILDGISVYNARIQMGRALAARIKKEYHHYAIDSVIPIPDTGRIIALEIARQLALPFHEGLIKNRYIGRTFIMPDQSTRVASVKRKLNVIKSECEGKNILLVDDSIVRGTTCQQIIQMVREAGARKVYFASAAPAITHPNVYGIDMPSATELVAHNREVQHICDIIRADGLIYQNLEDLIACVGQENPAIKAFDCSVFDGHYITGHVDQHYLQQLHQKRHQQNRSSFIRQSSLPIF